MSVRIDQYRTAVLRVLSDILLAVDLETWLPCSFWI